MFLKISIVFFILAVLSANADFPDDPKPCTFGDPQCIVDRINYYLNNKNDGSKAINLVSTDPLEIKKLSIKQGSESPVSIDLTFKNNLLYGLKTAKVYKVKGFGKDLNTNHEIHLNLDELHLIGPYKISGKVLILPISGEGESNMTMTAPKIVVAFKGIPYEKDGETYMKIKDFKIKVTPKGLHYHFENLFNGDKALNDNMNIFLNENAFDIYGELQGNMEKDLARIISDIFNDVFKTYPYEKFYAS